MLFTISLFYKEMIKIIYYSKCHDINFKYVLMVKPNLVTLKFSNKDTFKRTQKTGVCVDVYVYVCMCGYICASNFHMFHTHFNNKYKF